MKEFIIPESWADVKLKDYTKFYNALKPYENTDEYSDKFLDRASLYLCSIPSDILRKMPNTQFDEISQLISKLFSDVNDIPLLKQFELGETKYGFIPNLDDMSYGEYIDLVTYSKNTWANMAAIMTILYRPITETHWSGKYSIQKYTGTNEDMVDVFQDKLTMDIVFGAHSFFLNGLSVLLKDIAMSSNKLLKAHKNNTQLNQALQKNGLSMELLSLYLEETQSILTEPQK
jgi:hypothetical protein